MAADEPEVKIQSLIEKLLRNSIGSIETFVSDVKINLKVENTKAISHCYIVNLDANGRPRVDDLAQFVALQMIDYSIPRKEIETAKKHDLDNNTTTATSQLYKKAKSLFNSLDKSGEGGEMLLYLLVQHFLKLPQLICKMPLKTNSDLHYHGADGIHVSVETDADGNDILCLHWGESKLYKDVAAGISDCINSLKDFLLSTGGSDGRGERDLQLVQEGIHTINDEKLENLLVKYFDKNDPQSNRLKFKGVCLIGFDSEKYPSTANTESIQQVKDKIETEIESWLSKVKSGILKHQSLDTFEIDVFLIPFPEVDLFRKAFLKEIE